MELVEQRLDRGLKLAISLDRDPDLVTELTVNPRQLATMNASGSHLYVADVCMFVQVLYVSSLVISMAKWMQALFRSRGALQPFCSVPADSLPPTSSRNVDILSWIRGSINLRFRCVHI